MFIVDSDNEQMSPVSINQGHFRSSSSYMLDLNLEANTVYLSRPADVEYKTIERNEINFKDKEETTVVRPSEKLEVASESGILYIFYYLTYLLSYKLAFSNFNFQNFGNAVLTDYFCQGWFNPSVLREENEEKFAYSSLNEAYEQHEQSFLKQLLSDKGLSHSWADVIIPLTHEIVSVIMPGIVKSLFQNIYLKYFCLFR